MDIKNETSEMPCGKRLLRWLKEECEEQGLDRVREQFTEGLKMILNKYSGDTTDKKMRYENK